MNDICKSRFTLTNCHTMSNPPDTGNVASSPPAFPVLSLLSQYSPHALLGVFSAAAIAYVLFQMKLFPRSISRIVSKLFFYPTLPITALMRYGNYWSPVDDTVILGCAPVAWLGHPNELYKQGVRGVINMCDEYAGPTSSYKALGIKQLRLPTVDHFEPSVQSLREAVKFIDEYRRRKEKVYVHCKAGHGRGASAALAWLMYRNRDLSARLFSGDSGMFYTNDSPFAKASSAATDELELAVRDLIRYLEYRAGTPVDQGLIYATAKCGLTLQEMDIRSSAPGASVRGLALAYIENATRMASTFENLVPQEVMYFWSIRRAILLHTMGRPGDAIVACRDALSLAATDSDVATALYHQGRSLLMLGQASDALSTFREVIALAPERLTVYRDIVRCHKYLKDFKLEDWYIMLEEIEFAVKYHLTHNSLEDNNEVMWALHEVAESAGLFHQAWKYLDQARQLEGKRRKGWGETCDSEAALKRSSAIVNVFHKDFWSPLASETGSNSKLPVFIVGIPRSGSTLLEAILDAHKDFATIREDSALAASIASLKADEAKLRKRFPSSVDGSSDAKRDVSYDSAWKELIRVRSETIEKTMVSEAMQVSGAKHRPKRVVDKLLTNYYNIGAIHLLFPNSTIIHIFRDPRDTIVSLMKHNFAHPSLCWSLDDHDLVIEYQSYLQLMGHFSSVLPRDRIVDVRYEKLISDPETVLRALFKKIGVKWDREVLVRYQQKRRDYILTPSYLQVREPLSNRSVGIWKKYIREPSFFSLLSAVKQTIDRVNESTLLRFVDTSSWGDEIMLERKLSSQKRTSEL